MCYASKINDSFLKEYFDDHFLMTILMKTFWWLFDDHFLDEPLLLTIFLLTNFFDQIDFRSSHKTPDKRYFDKLLCSARALFKN